MNEEWSDLRRVAATSGVYAAGVLAQRGLAFILLPIYTRYIEPAQYGILELLSAFTSIVFLFLLLGLDSAINKAYHRDCNSVEEQRSVLPTALVLSAPPLALGTLTIAIFAKPIGNLLLGDQSSPDLIYLSITLGLLSSITGLFLASLRARQAARSFALLSFTQLLTAMLVNIVLVVKFEMGIRGVLIGNISSYLVALPLTALAARRGFTAKFQFELAKPMLTFGLLLIPSALAAWFIDLSDRYLLRVFRDLSEVALYAVGYKIGMLVQLVIVWPFQLAWPAVSFSIGSRDGHERTYSQALTYLVLLLVYSVLGLSLLSNLVVPAILDPSYHGADRVVPWIAIAYSLNGVYYCVSPGVLIAGYAHYIAVFSGAAALINLGLNLILIPKWGMIGAASATIFSFATLAGLTAALGQRVHPVPYENRRLVKASLLGAALFGLAQLTQPDTVPGSILWFLVFGVVAFPTVLLLTGFFDHEERHVAVEFAGRVRRWAHKRGGSGND